MGASTLDAGAALGVSVLRFPADAHVRDHLATFRQPRILLVEPGAQPPVLLDELEDWMRSPADPADLRARGRELHRRALDAVPESPALDDQGLLWVGQAWVDLTPAQAPVVALLIEHLERVVRYDVVSATYERAGGSGHAASLRTLLTRIGARVRPLGLELVTVRRRGVVLTQHPRIARLGTISRHAHGEAPPEAASPAMAPVRTRSLTRSTSSGLSLAPSWSVTSKRSITSPSWALTFADRTSTWAAANEVASAWSSPGRSVQRTSHTVCHGDAALSKETSASGSGIDCIGPLGGDLDVLGQRRGVGARPSGTWKESSTAPSGQVARTPSSTTSGDRRAPL